jgi:hypothetical protein
LGDQNRDTIEVNAIGYANHYLEFNRLDLDLGEITAGPRFRFPNVPVPHVDDVSIKPYAIVNEVGLGEQQYFWTYGAGIEMTGTFFGDVATKLSAEFRQKTFADAPDRPLSTGLSGNDTIVSLSATKPVTENSSFSTEFDYLDQSTRFTYYSNMTYAISAGYRIRYADPTGFLKFPLETAFFGSRSWAYYESPDPCCSTSGNPAIFSPSDRFDRHWRFGVTQVFQFAQNAAVILQFQRDIVSSNLGLYGYTSDSVLLGPQIRF